MIEKAPGLNNSSKHETPSIASLLKPFNRHTYDEWLCRNSKHWSNKRSSFIPHSAAIYVNKTEENMYCKYYWVISNTKTYVDHSIATAAGSLKFAVRLTKHKGKHAPAFHLTHVLDQCGFHKWNHQALNLQLFN